ncbi:quinohemoprotein amine dehydrogenase subunit alpha [Motiliproteus sp. SC1-56]|uniref:quinohemoprotein amine dehydrogenase subunit alpha n=1 Tax=Motiliproteus sp. SC1-56 TaxID=2799565 RepID=UPI001F5D430E|nr:quinohemoprotein amine dehydrogenase subunit alpha [Motiliproteus sp. SC1-56]
MKTTKSRWNTGLSLSGGAALALSGLMVWSTPAAADGQQLIRERCLDCHTETGDAAAPFSRISQLRKTPEGWEMTLNRMQALRGLKISAEEKRELIKYLADTQGLAPAETRGLRYVLEQDRNHVENLENEAVAGTCAGCHSGARVALQRRSAEEWKKLVHFHMGQFPTIELIAGARDHAWFDRTLNEVAPALSSAYPLSTPEWSQWQAAPKASLEGSWRLVGWLPEKGEFDATLSAQPQGDDRYQLKITGQYADGSALEGNGLAQVYTGYEWRANLTLDGVPMRQVLAADENGETLQGRMFLRDAKELGGEIRAVKAKKGLSRLLSVSPGYLKRGQTQTLTLHGAQLSGEIDLGEGITLVKVLARDADRIEVVAKASESAGIGSRALRVGGAQGADLVVYDKLARVDVTPGQSIARVGGNGGQLAKQKVAFRAVGYAAGKDGTPGTEDDLRLGYVPAQWSLKAFDEVAQADNDLKYAGTIDAETGLFIPGDAGPNPERRMSTNNVGQLAVVATVDDGDGPVSGENHLLVAVQTFMFPVIQ